MSTLPKLSPSRGAPAVVIPHRSGLLRRWPQRLKRCVDVCIAAFLGVVTLPLGLLIAGAILIESGGPVFYGQTRLGRRGRRFRIWKFRSMVDNAAAVLDAHLESDLASALEWRVAHKLRNDPRITRVGRLLRRTSIDELPQLWNVLRGEMSMVGPRPIVAEEIPKYGSAFALYSQVLPGLTGLWQVSGRNDTTYHERVQLDAHYVLAWTAALDLRVLWKTISVVVGGHGAY